MILSQTALASTAWLLGSVLFKNWPLLIELRAEVRQAATVGTTIFERVKILAWLAQTPLAPKSSSLILFNRASVELGKTCSTAPHIFFASALVTIGKIGEF